MINWKKIDLHMHSTVSDGTDTPQELLQKVKEAGIALFALTDHDAIKGCAQLRACLTEDDPRLLTGAEFSCKDEEGKYHILAYNYDPDSPAIHELVEAGHRLRIKKFTARLDFLAEKFGFTFPEEERQALLALDNPGKPHIGNLMVKYGYAPDKDVAIHDYINQAHFRSEYLRPEQAIAGILGSGGIPVLAHPAFGSGEELIVGRELDDRVRRLVGYGLQGIEAYYSTFTPKLRGEALAIAERYDLYVTAGSDYHGRNKLVALGDTRLHQAKEPPAGLLRFLESTGVQAAADS